MLAKRDLLGGRDAESAVGEDHEVLHEGLCEGDQSEFLGADDPEKIGEDQNRQDVGDRLKDRKRCEIAEHYPAFTRRCKTVSFFYLTDQSSHGSDPFILDPGKWKGMVVHRSFAVFLKSFL